MNKIEVVNDVITKKKLDGALKLMVDDGTEFMAVKQLKITVLKSTTLTMIDHGTKPSKLNIIIDVEPNQTLRLEEIHVHDQIKIQYQYRIYENAKVKVNRMLKCHQVRKWDIAYLNGENAQFSLCESALAYQEQDDHVLVYHNNSNTKSFFCFRGVTLEHGRIQLSMAGIVENNMKQCKLEQDGKIMAVNDQVSDIQTNYVAEEEKTIKVDSHTALNHGEYDCSEIRQFLTDNIKFTKECQQVFEKELERLEVSYES